MRKLLTMLAWGAIFLAGVGFLTPADARRGGGVRMGGGHSIGHARGYRGNLTRNVAVGRSVNRNVNVNRTVNRNVNRQYVYRNGRRGYWRNGIWVAAPVVAGSRVIYFSK